MSERAKGRCVTKWEDSIRTESKTIWSLASRKEGQLASIYHYTGVIPNMALSIELLRADDGASGHQSRLGLGLLASVWLSLYLTNPWEKKEQRKEERQRREDHLYSIKRRNTNWVTLLHIPRSTEGESLRQSTRRSLLTQWTSMRIRD